MVVIALFFVAVPALRHRLVGGGAAVVSEEIEGTEGTFGGHVEEVVEEQDRFGDSFATDLREAFDRQDPASEPTQSESVAAATETESAENEEYSGNLIGVNINADPWAHVEVDGVYVGLTPLADVRLTPGLHRIRARLPDGKIVERDVQIDDANRHIAIAP